MTLTHLHNSEIHCFCTMYKSLYFKNFGLVFLVQIFRTPKNKGSVLVTIFSYILVSYVLVHFPFVTQLLQLIYFVCLDELANNKCKLQNHDLYKIYQEPYLIENNHIGRHLFATLVFLIPNVRLNVRWQGSLCSNLKKILENCKKYEKRL